MFLVFPDEGVTLCDFLGAASNRDDKAFVWPSRRRLCYLPYEPEVGFQSVGAIPQCIETGALMALQIGTVLPRLMSDHVEEGELMPRWIVCKARDERRPSSYSTGVGAFIECLEIFETSRPRVRRVDQWWVNLENRRLYGPHGSWCYGTRPRQPQPVTKRELLSKPGRLFLVESATVSQETTSRWFEVVLGKVRGGVRHDKIRRLGAEKKYNPFGLKDPT